METKYTGYCEWLTLQYPFHPTLLSTVIQCIQLATDSGMAPHYSKPEVSKLFYRGSDSKHFSFVGHLVSVPTTQLSHCNTKAAINNKKKNGLNYVPKKLYLQHMW